MISEHKEVKHFDQWTVTSGIINSIQLKTFKFRALIDTYHIKNLYFYNSLIFESFFIFDHFNGNHFLGQFTFTLDDLTESTLSKKVQYLISIFRNQSSFNFTYSFPSGVIIESATLKM